MDLESLLLKLKDALNKHDINSFIECFDENYFSEQPVHPDRTFLGHILAFIFKILNLSFSENSKNCERSLK